MTYASVVIPAYNSEKTMRECVESVLANEYERFEVIVVDDNSTDNTVEILKSFRDRRLKICKNEVNLGASYSRNRGIRESQGDIVILLDADSYVNSDWVRRHVSTHKVIDADIIGGGIVGVHDTIFGRADAYCTWWTSIPGSGDRYIEKLHLPSNNMSLKKTVFERIGYFNEQLRVGSEDAEFCHRALQGGVRIYFKSDVVAYHHDRSDFKGFLRHQANWGVHAVKARKYRNMDYAWLMPDSYILAHFYVLPLTFLYTGFVVSRWVQHDPKVLIYSPLIFMGKLRRVISLIYALKESSRG